MEFVALGEFFSITLALNHQQFKMTRKPVQPIKATQMVPPALPLHQQQQNRPTARQTDDEPLNECLRCSSCVGTDFSCGRLLNVRI